MITTLTMKKLGNHWYPAVNHKSLVNLTIDVRLERLLNRMDKFKDEQIDITIIQQGDIILQEGLIQFEDKDILRYMTTSDNFDMKLYISGHEFSISSDLYTILEANYQFDFHKEVYRIVI